MVRVAWNYVVIFIYYDNIVLRKVVVELTDGTHIDVITQSTYKLSHLKSQVFIRFDDCDLLSLLTKMHGDEYLNPRLTRACWHFNYFNKRGYWCRSCCDCTLVRAMRIKPAVILDHLGNLDHLFKGYNLLCNLNLLEVFFVYLLPFFVPQRLLSVNIPTLYLSRSFIPTCRVPTQEFSYLLGLFGFERI